MSASNSPAAAPAGAFIATLGTASVACAGVPPVAIGIACVAIATGIGVGIYCWFKK